MTDADDRRKPDEPPRPWWRHRMMWLVVGGPAVVVVAALVTAVIAIRGADVVIEDSKAGAKPDDPNAPALKARNHAASPPQR